MRARFTFVFLLLLVLLTVGAFLSYMEGFLTFDRGGLRAFAWITRPWSKPAPPGPHAETRDVADAATDRETGTNAEDRLRAFAGRHKLRLELEPGVQLSGATLDTVALTSASMDQLAEHLGSVGLGAVVSPSALRVVPMHLRRRALQETDRGVPATDIALTATLSLREEESWARLSDGDKVYRLGLLPRDAGGRSDGAESTMTIVQVFLKEDAAVVSTPTLWLEDGRETHMAAVPAQPIEIHAMARRLGADQVRVSLNLRRVRP